MDRYLNQSKRPRIDSGPDVPELGEAASADDITKPAGPEDISQFPSEGPRQPILKLYPARQYEQQKRSFNNSWYSSYAWLEYSIQQDAVFCFSCRHFNKSAPSAYTYTGFNNWKKAVMSLKTHDTSTAHKNSMTFWAEFKNKLTDGARVRKMLDAGHAAFVQENRCYIRAVIESLLYTCKQNIAQRGHKEDQKSTNKGNFLKCLTSLLSSMILC